MARAPGDFATPPVRLTARSLPGTPLTVSASVVLRFSVALPAGLRPGAGDLLRRGILERRRAPCILKIPFLRLIGVREREAVYLKYVITVTIQISLRSARELG